MSKPIKPILHITTATMDIAEEVNEMLDRYKAIREDYIVLASVKGIVELKVFNGDEVEEMTIDEFKKFLKVGK